MKQNNSKSKTNGKRNFRKGNGKGSYAGRENKEATVSTKSERFTSTAADNDPSWYAANPQLCRDYASYPFGYPLGGSYPVDDTIYTQRLPGVMALRFVPTVGVATDETSPINVAMRKLYSFVRYANSGSKNYDAPDLMLYIVAVDSAHMYLEFLKRAYGVMMNYTAFNRYYPRALVTAMGLDYDDLQANLANFRGYINQYAVKLNQLWIPNGFSYLKRHQWLCQHIYVDSADSYKAQTFFFMPSNYYKFVLKGDPVVGACDRASLPSKATLADIISLGNTLLDPLITNEDIGIMAGDILKAYGAANMLQTMGIDENYRVLPEYSEEVMSSVENMTFLWPGDTSSGVITQDTTIGGGFLKSQPYCNYEVYKSEGSTLGTPPDNIITNIADAMFKPIDGSRMLNLHKASPTPEDVIVATRGMAVVDPSSIKKVNRTGPNLLFCVQANVDSCGSEIFTDARMYVITDDGIDSHQLKSADWTVADINDQNSLAETVSTILTKVSMLNQFDWHPLIDFCTLTGNEQEYYWSYPLTPNIDADTFTFIDRENLSNMHTVALLSEFTVPMVQ